MKFICFCLLFIICNIKCIAQNLIPDSSFSIYKKKAEYDGRIKDLKYWFSSNQATPDNYNFINKENLFAIPKNYGGFQFPKSGNTFAGICVYVNDIKIATANFREYISTQLIQSLTQNKLYCISFYISTADNSHYIANGLDVVLSLDKIKEKGEAVITNLNYYTLVKDTAIINNTLSWVKKCFTLKALLPYNYLTIGNFKEDDSTKIQIRKKEQRKNSLDFLGAYYYIDDVSIKSIRDSSECSCYEKPEKVYAFTDTITHSALTVGDRIILKNIFFETGKYQLQNTSYEELNKLVNLLKSQATLQIEISGHTDNIGKVEDNLKLSENRAKAVVEYLQSKGVNITRLRYAGYGSYFPIDTNETEEGRAKNRRVEMKIIGR